MVSRGLIEEVGSLARGRGLLDSPVAKAIGYRQTIEYLLEGGETEEDFKAYLDRFKAATRRYAKQQQQVSSRFRRQKSHLVTE